MTADVTIEATPGQVAAIERDGFLVVAGPTTQCRNGLHIYTDEPVREYHCPACDRPPYRSKDGDWYCFDPKGESECHWRGPNPDLRWCCSPVPTTKPCPACGGSPDWPCHRCGRPNFGGNVGTVPIVVEVVVPNPSNTVDAPKGIVARTILRGTAEAVPVVDDVNDWPTEEGTSFLYVEGELLMLYTVDPEADDGYEGWDLSAYGDDGGHFADVPRPEVGDTAWIIRGEG